MQKSLVIVLLSIVLCDFSLLHSHHYIVFFIYSALNGFPVYCICKKIFFDIKFKLFRKSTTPCLTENQLKCENLFDIAFNGDEEYRKIANDRLGINITSKRYARLKYLTVKYDQGEIRLISNVTAYWDEDSSRRPHNRDMSVFESREGLLDQILFNLKLYM